MANPSTCLHCGVPLVRGARQEFCPKCLFLQASAGLLGPARNLNAEDRESEVSGLNSAVGAPDGASASASRKSEAKNRFGDYELLEEIGRGGMGVVYRARQRSLDRVVAIKMMAFGPNSNPDLVKRFRAEAVSAASLHHPNIVAIHEVGIHEDRHFFVMDHVEGRSLARVISNLRSQISNHRQSARWMKTTAEAVHYAHERGILHRDLKPSNVLIDAQDQPHVVDFGLARQLEGDSELTVTGQVLGSPQYLPPEQAAGPRGRVSRRTDVYALGATLYHLLTGRPPFQAESLAQTLDLVLHAEPVAPRLLNPSVPRDLETICLKCLEKEPARRYPTAQELADELARFLAGEPIQARPTGPAGKAWRWCRRKPQLAAAIGVALLSLLIGFAGVTWQWRRAEAGELSAQRRAYISEINAAQAALKANNPGRALELLNRHRPAGKSEIRNPESEIDLRGFEWRYLWQQCQTEAEAVVGRLPDAIPSLEVSGDGQWLMAASEAGAVTLWHLATGEEIPLASARGARAFGAFSPDSRWLLFCDQSLQTVDRIGGAIGVWDLQARKRLPPITDPRPVGPMGFSPDGNWFGYGVALFSPGKEDTGKAVVLLAFPSREKTREMPGLTPITTLEHGCDWVFTADSERIIFSETDPDRRIGLWDFRDESRPSYFPGHREAITAMALSPDGRVLATGAGYTDKEIRLWEIPSFRALGELSGHAAWIRALEFSPDGRTLASASTDQTIRLWDLPTRQPKRVFRGLAAEVWRLGFAPDGRKLFSGSGDGTIHRWSAEPEPSGLTRSFWRAEAGLNPVTVASNGRQFAGIRQGSVCVGQTHGAAPASPVLELGTNNTCLLFSPEGQSLFAGTESGEIQIWSLERRQLWHSLRGFAEPTQPVTRLLQHEQGDILVALRSMEEGQLAPPVQVEVWNTTSWRQQRSFTISGTASCYEVSPDGRWLAAGDFRGPIRMWSLTGSSETRTISAVGQTISLVFSPDGKLLAAAALEGVVRVWQMPELTEPKQFRARAHSLFALAFSPDSRRLAIAGEGQEAIKLWEVDSGQELITLSRDGETLSDLRFSADGNQLIARSLAGNLLFWPVPSFAEIEAEEENGKGR